MLSGTCMNSRCQGELCFVVAVSRNNAIVGCNKFPVCIVTSLSESRRSKIFRSTWPTSNRRLATTVASTPPWLSCNMGNSDSMSFQMRLCKDSSPLFGSSTAYQILGPFRSDSIVSSGIWSSLFEQNVPNKTERSKMLLSVLFSTMAKESPRYSIGSQNNRLGCTLRKSASGTKKGPRINLPCGLTLPKQTRWSFDGKHRSRFAFLLELQLRFKTLTEKFLRHGHSVRSKFKTLIGGQKAEVHVFAEAI